MTTNGLAMRCVPKGIAYRYCCVPSLIISVNYLISMSLHNQTSDSGKIAPPCLPL